MQQNVFKREFYVLFDAVKTESVQYLEEKIKPIKKIVMEKIQEKKSLKLSILRNPDRISEKSFEVFLLQTKFSINRTSCLGLNLYINKLFILLLLEVT